MLSVVDIGYVLFILIPNPEYYIHSPPESLIAKNNLFTEKYVNKFIIRLIMFMPNETNTDFSIIFFMPTALTFYYEVILF